MDWQQVASLSIVAVTAVLLGRHVINRRRRGARALCVDCTCAVTETTGPAVHTDQHLTATSGSGENSVLPVA